MSRLLGAYVLLSLILFPLVLLACDRGDVPPDPAMPGATGEGTATVTPLQTVTPATSPEVDAFPAVAGRESPSLPPSTQAPSKAVAVPTEVPASLPPQASLPTPTRRPPSAEMPVPSPTLPPPIVPQPSDTPGPTALPDATPTLAETPVPARSGLTPQDAVEAGEVLKGPDGAEIVVTEIVEDYWARIPQLPPGAETIPRPGKDYRHYLIRVGFANAAGESLIYADSLVFRLMDANQVIYYPYENQNFCGYDFPDRLYGELFPGARGGGESLL